MNASKLHSSRTHRVLSLAALFALLVISAFGITQCRMVDQSVTGVDPSLSSFNGRSRHDSCARNCRRRFKEAMKKESARYHDALEACKKDRFCRRKERDFHRDVVAQLRAERSKCLEGCRYNEGGGRGGD